MIIESLHINVVLRNTPIPCTLISQHRYSAIGDSLADLSRAVRRRVELYTDVDLATAVCCPKRRRRLLSLAISAMKVTELQF